MIKNKFPGLYLFYPVLIFSVFFAFEKLSLMTSVKKLTQGDATFLYFDYKNELMDEMAVVVSSIKNSSDPFMKSKKTVAVLGSSRLLYFDYKRFARNFPDRELFNFSAPVTAPAYYFYILSSLNDRGVTPDFILLETDPFQFNDESGAFVKSNLSYSFDLSFILRHQNLFKNDEISYFLGRWLFASYKYTPDLKKLMKRLQNPDDPYLKAFDELDGYQRKNRGAGLSIIPRENWYERDFATLEVSSRKSINWLYGNYKISERQFSFLENAILLAREKGAVILLVRPPVSRPMQRMLDADENLSGKMKKWNEVVEQLSQKYSVRYLDLTNHERFYCNTFVDGAHMSLDCYHPFMVEVMRNFDELERVVSEK